MPSLDGHGPDSGRRPPPEPVMGSPPAPDVPAVVGAAVPPMPPLVTPSVESPPAQAAVPVSTRRQSTIPVQHPARTVERGRPVALTERKSNAGVGRAQVVGCAANPEHAAEGPSRARRQDHEASGVRPPEARDVGRGVGWRLRDPSRRARAHGACGGSDGTRMRGPSGATRRAKSRSLNVSSASAPSNSAVTRCNAS